MPDDSSDLEIEYDSESSDGKGGGRTMSVAQVAKTSCTVGDPGDSS